ncbi:response regulator transcription factor [Arthrobacter sp. CAN_C5]|uniref:response regulator transcription factor n=1 Tax=Arthrobacter sp. CAN_C5 TaxID=2760706 RepID=UPI0028B1BB05|nr:response regulator transcription factor [Arthrobacter sp. CAN_C5]MBP2216440.1 DNA-binding response OmpR family regulator [Arthrobacter sp. CAN_C5]
MVIEDDNDTRLWVLNLLRLAGFEVHSSATGLGGAELVAGHAPALVVVGAELRGIDGFEVLRRIRSFSDCYVVMLGAHADEVDILTAFHAGADDYLAKPVRPRELRARFDAVLRRPRRTTVTPYSTVTPDSILRPAVNERSEVDRLHPVGTSNVLRHGDLMVDHATRTVSIDDDEVLLTKSEFDLLHEMLSCDGAVRTKSTLAGIARGSDYQGFTGSRSSDERGIEVHIGNLRRKLPRRQGEAELITTVRGIGYRIVSATVRDDSSRTTGPHCLPKVDLATA